MSIRPASPSFPKVNMLAQDFDSRRKAEVMTRVNTVFLTILQQSPIPFVATLYTSTEECGLVAIGKLYFGYPVESLDNEINQLRSKNDKESAVWLKLIDLYLGKISLNHFTSDEIEETTQSIVATYGLLHQEQYFGRKVCEEVDESNMAIFFNHYLPFHYFFALLGAVREKTRFSLDANAAIYDLYRHLNSDESKQIFAEHSLVDQDNKFIHKQLKDHVTTFFIDIVLDKLAQFKGNLIQYEDAVKFIDIISAFLLSTKGINLLEHERIKPILFK